VTSQSDPRTRLQTTDQDQKIVGKAEVEAVIRAECHERTLDFAGVDGLLLTVPPHAVPAVPSRPRPWRLDGHADSNSCQFRSMDNEFIDLPGLGYLQFHSGGGGEFVLGTVQGGFDLGRS
jgi:hypothetical protein